VDEGNLIGTMGCPGITRSQDEPVAKAGVVAIA